MTTQAESWVRERRLRPLYELLDSGNNRKVITEAEKLMKKVPNFSCAKVLKALALIRLGRIDEARDLLNPVIQEAPTEDATIQALSICYRELDEPASLVTVLEAACKKEQTEELLTHCFMAQVRVLDYQKQHHTALNLYKTFNKPSYFGWAIASLVLKYETTEAKNGLALLPLQLAERMCDKFLLESRALMDDSIMDVYLSTLEKLEKYEKLLQVMKDYGYPQSEWTYDNFHVLYCKALRKLDKMDVLLEYLKSSYMSNLDEYCILQEIIEIFGGIQKESVKSFLDFLRENNPSRVVALADLLFCQKCCQNEDISSRVEEDFKMAIKYGVDKLSFYSELSSFFSLINQSSVADALLKIMTPPYLDRENNFDQVGKIISDVNYEMVCREILPASTPQDKIKRAERCFGKYLVCERAKEGLTNEHNMKTKESDFHDQFLVLAASSLLEEYYNSQSSKDNTAVINAILKKKKEWHCRDGYPKELMHLLKEMNSNGEITEDFTKSLDGLYMDDDVLCNEDIILVFITAMLMLEYGVSKTPYNHSLRIMLAKGYCNVGASLQSLRSLHQLDLKHVQWDSLGYLVFSEGITGGLYQESLKMLNLAEHMYLGYKRESMEHVITTYKYGTFDKIPEFLRFRDMLLNSTQCGLVFIEKRLLEYLVATNTSAELRKIAESISKELTPSLLEKDIFADNRDFSVLQGLGEDVDLELLKKLTAEADTHYHKIRMSLLFCLTKLVNLSSNFEDANRRADIIKCIAAFDNYVKAWDDVYPTYPELHVSTPIFQGMWPPRCQKYKELGCFKVLNDMLGYTKELLNSQDIDQPPLESLKSILQNGVKILLDQLTCSNNRKELRALSELSIPAGFTKIHFILETMSFLRIILDSAIKFDKHRVNAWKLDMNKKGRVVVMSNHKKVHHDCIRSLHDSVRAIANFSEDFREKMKNYKFNRFVEKKDKFEILLRPGFLFKPVEDFYSTFFDNIGESIKVQMNEFQRVALNLADYFKNEQLSIQ